MFRFVQTSGAPRFRFGLLSFLFWYVCVCVCECARARVCKCVFSSANIRTPALNVLLFVLQALLGAPEPEDPLDTSIAEMWKGDIAQAHATG